jgi:hypothetical protein
VRRPARTAALAATALLLAAVPPALARGGADDPPDHDRDGTTTTAPAPPPPPAASAQRAGACGTRSEWRLRLRDSGGWLAVRLDVRTRGRAATGRWRVIVLHERRIAVRTTAVSRRGSLRYLTRVRDLPGSEVVAVRATSPAGETCASSVRL